jgi:hypothetical protein
MSERRDRLHVVCPCCQATLSVDAKTGLVLNSQAKKLEYSFEHALEEVQRKKDKADEVFQKAFADEKRRRDSLEEKFQQALESQEELPEPTRPWELD